MKWLKYRHKFSHGRSEWEWAELPGDADNAEIAGHVETLAREYDYSDKYSGVDYEVVPKAPRWVIEGKLSAARMRKLKAEDDINTLTREALDNTYECSQCKDATSAADEFASHKESRRRIESCPSCGRRVVYETLSFWLMPDDIEAVKLLGSLVEQGKRSVKSKKFRWPLEEGAETEAYSRLSALGLVIGSAHQNVYEISASKSGEVEWVKHKAAQKGATS